MRAQGLRKVSPAAQRLDCPHDTRGRTGRGQYLGALFTITSEMGGPLELIPGRVAERWEPELAALRTNFCLAQIVEAPFKHLFILTEN